MKKLIITFSIFALVLSSCGVFRRTADSEIAVKQKEVFYEVVSNNDKVEYHCVLAPRVISTSDGIAVLELRKFVEPYHGIAVRWRGNSSILEIRRIDGYYLVSPRWDNVMKYATLEEGLTEWLKDYLEWKDARTRARTRNESLPQGFYWNLFEQENKIQLIIDTIKELVDDESLNAPFNNIYG